MKNQVFKNGPFRALTRNYMGAIVCLFALPLLFLGSGCTSSMRIQVLKPAHIMVPESVQNLALINRYRPGKGEGLLNVLEGALTGENIGQDRRAAEMALSGLTNSLAGSPRFKITRPAIELKGTGRGDFPEALPVQRVREICANNRAQALVTIEAFDSDTRIECERDVRERKKDGKTIKYVVFEACKTVDVTVGWRMYDGNTGNLLDEFRMFESVIFNAEGGTDREARANLPDRDGVTQRIGDVTGANYSRRISPTWLWVSRSYFKRGCDDLKRGKNAVKLQDWRGAEEHWNNATEFPKEKVQGRAYYNLALAAEMRGELNEALELCKKAGRTYGNKKAINYASIIRQRIRDQERLAEQMKGAPE
ncbi:MAG: DUF6340 family protein [Bacteroidota bacterium]